MGCLGLVVFLYGFCREMINGTVTYIIMNSAGIFLVYSVYLFVRKSYNIAYIYAFIENCI